MTVAAPPVETGGRRFTLDFWTLMTWLTLLMLATLLIAPIFSVLSVSFIDPKTMQLIASVAFIVFGLWTIRGDKLDGEDNASRFSPFWTVVIAFFLAEMGDKTQFATITLAAHYQALLPVLAGTTTGMMLADGLGIIVGMVLHKAIPERALKWIAAVIFIGCGAAGLYGAL